MVTGIVTWWHYDFLFTNVSVKLAFICTGHSLLANHAVMKRNLHHLPVTCHYIMNKFYLIGCVWKGHQQNGPKLQKLIWSLKHSNKLHPCATAALLVLLHPKDEKWSAVHFYLWSSVEKTLISATGWHCEPLATSFLTDSAYFCVLLFVFASFESTHHLRISSQNDSLLASCTKFCCISAKLPTDGFQIELLLIIANLTAA